MSEECLLSALALDLECLVKANKAPLYSFCETIIFQIPSLLQMIFLNQNSYFVNRPNSRQRYLLIFRIAANQSNTGT